MNLNLIYHFKVSQKNNGFFTPPSYGVLYFFSDEGFVDINLLKELSKSVPDADHENLNFMNLDDLKKFALRVCQELSVKEVRLMSVQDYNIGLDGARDLESFKGIFSKYGEVVENEAVRKKGFFGKLFS